MTHELHTSEADYQTMLNELVQRIAALEHRHTTPPTVGAQTAGDDDAAMASDDDPFLTEQAPTTMLTPYPAFMEALPSLGNDFFRTIMDDDMRWAFLHECPRNTARQYQPPPLNDLDVDERTKNVDRQLRAIQYRLSGITRPIDLFVHDVVRSNQISTRSALRFANTINALLSDVASVVTQTCSDMVCCDVGLAVAPITDPTQLPNLPLLDATRVLEQTQLTQALRKATRRSQPICRHVSNRPTETLYHAGESAATRVDQTTDRRHNNNNNTRGQSGFRARGRNTSRKRFPPNNEHTQ